MSRLPRTLSFRLTAWYVCIFSLTLLAVFVVLYVSVGTILDHQSNNDLVEDIEEFRLFHARGGLDAVKAEIEHEISSDDPAKMFFRILDETGAELHTTDQSAFEGIDDFPVRLDELAADGEPLITVGRLVDGEHGLKVAIGALAPGAIMQLGESTEEHDELMTVVMAAFLAAYVVILPVASLIGWMIARKAARGIRTVSETAGRIHRGALDERVSTDFRELEIQQLAGTFNAMLDRIADLITEIRQMTDNIAHDLRSPLARIRAVWENALQDDASPEAAREAASATLIECDRLLDMINATLDLAELEAGMGEGDSVDVSEMARDACELFEPVAEEKRIELTGAVEPGCMVEGNRHYLQRMLANLLDNALKYTATGGRVGLGVTRNGANVLVEVWDTGIGIVPEHQEKVFERFFRCDPSRQQESCGMGLSFARAVARAHGGDVTLRSENGNGSRFTVALPLFA